MTRRLPPELLAAVSQSIEAQLGLHYPPERAADLERGIQAAASELGFADIEQCARQLTSGKLDRAQTEALAAHLTVGETYFFRDPAVFAALTSHVIPALMEERRGRTKRLRIWSAGCCTAEEPYSIAIAVRRAIPDLQDWHITILATDVNPRFLQKAATGLYGRWSFRGVPEETRSAYFRPTPEGRFELVPAVRKMVTFARLNLADDVYPSLATNTNAMDLIFCRNVLMYFSQEQMQRVVANLRRSLVEGGRLVVSATEASRETFADFVPDEVAGITLYRKQTLPPSMGSKLPSPAEPAPTPLEPPLDSSLPAATAAVDHAAEARRFANDGHLVEALAACDRALAENRLVPAHHYLRGVILQEHNASGEAAAALQRALYLDPDFVIAHFALGHLQMREGRHREAARSFANARDLASAAPREAILPESDGLTAGRLLEILRTMEESLG